MCSSFISQCRKLSGNTRYHRQNNHNYIEDKPSLVTLPPVNTKQPYGNCKKDDIYCQRNQTHQGKPLNMYICRNIHSCLENFGKKISAQEEY